MILYNPNFVFVILPLLNFQTNSQINIDDTKNKNSKNF